MYCACIIEFILKKKIFISQYLSVFFFFFWSKFVLSRISID